MDLNNFKVTRLANATLSVPRWQIDGQIAVGDGRAFDLTAANLIFPNVLSTLSTQQQDAWVSEVVSNLLYRKYSIGGF